MPELEFANDTVLLRLDDGIFEIFELGFDKSLRVPVKWLGVQVKSGRHDNIYLNVGTGNPVAPSLYGVDVNVLGGAWPISTTTAEEPTYREFFGKVAAAAGRTISS